MVVGHGGARGARALQLFLRGHVQGVGFRWASKARADQLGVQGWVRNLDDKRVEVWIEGEGDAVLAMRTWLQSGPSTARVDGVEEHDQPLAGHDGFELRSTQRG